MIDDLDGVVGHVEQASKKRGSYFDRSARARLRRVLSAFASRLDADRLEGPNKVLALRVENQGPVIFSVFVHNEYCKLELESGSEAESFFHASLAKEKPALAKQLSPSGKRVAARLTGDNADELCNLFVQAVWLFLNSKSGTGGARDPSGPEAYVERAQPDEQPPLGPGEDGSLRAWRAIVQRQGQGRFREEVLAAYGGRCAVTGFDVSRALEAAHIDPYMGEVSNVVNNGLLLRADIHTLLDLYLMSFNVPKRGPPRVVLRHDLRSSSYEEYHGRPLRLPDEPGSRPSHKALRGHRERAGF